MELDIKYSEESRSKKSEKVYEKLERINYPD